MNFRTLIMLAVAALVIVIAVKMNRNPVAEPMLTEQTATEGYISEEPAAIVSEEEMIDESTIVTDDGVVIQDVPAETTSDEAITDEAMTGEEPVITEEETSATGDATMEATETESTVGGEPLTEEEAQAMEPAIVGESPAEAIESAPAEIMSDEPVETPAE